jgi:SPP1 gp7 family putative phage head morphogenesis protein
MTPEELARDAMRVVDRVERTTTRALLEYLQLIERDVRGILRGLDLTDVTRSRAFRELRARDALTQSRAARELLSMGSATGPLAERFREGITQAYEDGIRSARDAAISTGIVTAREASMALGMGARVDLEFLVALSRANLTNLDRVGRGGLDRIEDALVRGSVRGAGPRATARMVREAVDITRGEAERIVRTVFANANSEARMSTYREMRVQYVQWDATNDDRTCSYCEARHGIVWKRDQAPRPPAHPHCRCVLLPWREDSLARGDEYYLTTRRAMADRREDEGRAGSTATAAAPFDRANGTSVPPPAWAPGRGWLR